MALKEIELWKKLDISIFEGLKCVVKKVLFRADSSSAIGIGHIMRDLVLAKQYVNDNIIFAVQNLEGNINRKIKKAGYKIELLKSNDIKEVLNLIKEHGVDMIIIDSYNIDYKYEKQLKTENPNLKIMVFDDLYQKHHCNILLNHNISADEKRYKDLVPKDCELRCGSKYTLLRDEFKMEKEKKYPKNDKFTFFVAMGGTDSSNINISILEALSTLKDIKVSLVTTTANENLDTLLKYIKDKKWVYLHINSNTIAKLMKQSDCAIITPSVIANEVLFMGLPFIAIQVVSSNQNEMYNYLYKNQYLVLKNFNKKSFKQLLQKVL